ncbi:hypothetical protein HU200_056470 [Digitaria exilis]|uniref:Uncharacterized protein n=1 Tax=Digitaria exilis TaxID=1010633 RepID=A0A835ALM3_9POAL|nr:hypothetical protein HU200_056470 [Digitaria exilis]
MEMEGRGLSDLFRNTSEEIFLKAMMENSMGVATAPSMEMLGFRNMSQSFREDSEELFSSWLMNAEARVLKHTCDSFLCVHQRSQDLVQLAIALDSHLGCHQKLQAFRISSMTLLNKIFSLTTWNAAEKGMQASDILLAKVKPISLSNSVRGKKTLSSYHCLDKKRYAAMQTHVPPIITGSIEPTNQFKQDFINATNSTPMSNTPVQTPKFVSPSSSSTSPLDNPQVMAQDTVTSVVSMLKDTLERKKLGSHANNDASAGNSFGFYDTQQFQQNIIGGTDIFPLVSTSQVQDSPMLSRVERPMEPNHGNFIAPANQVWFGAPSREPSHSGSSTAMTAHSAGFEVCDELPLMGQAMSVCESTRKNAANGTTDCRPKGKEYRERVLKDNVKDDRKKAALTRMGSVTSEQAADNGDPTKKRRVERSRKMAEAKERSSTPVIPSDMQAVLKRCENLEKEVRSLKLNLSFMNRKDSEQTKQIEELQKQNEELTEEKERLLEEIERIV